MSLRVGKHCRGRRRNHIVSFVHQRRVFTPEGGYADARLGSIFQNNQIAHYVTSSQIESINNVIEGLRQIIPKTFRRVIGNLQCTTVR